MNMSLRALILVAQFFFTIPGHMGSNVVAVLIVSKRKKSIKNLYISKNLYKESI